MSPSRVSAHVRALWPRWPWLPAAPFVGLFAFWAIRRELRWDVVVQAIVIPWLAYHSPRTKRIYLALLPIGLVGLLYDLMRFVKNTGLRGVAVHVCDLRALEMRWFGVTVGGERMTVHDWFRAHPSTVLDVACAIPYGTFIFVVLGYAVYLFFRDPGLEQRFVWGFLALNVAGFATYHVYPAAPPWYFHEHGCLADLAVPNSTGAALARVDALMGIDYFRGMYGRASDVFGAVPSLHVSYPLLMALAGVRLHGALGKALLVGFFSMMCFSAVYLDHHWVIDVVAGTVYALSVWAITGLGARRFAAIAARVTGDPA